MTTRLAVFTDASRVEVEDGQYSAAYGWVSVDLEDPLKGIIEARVVKVKQKQARSTMHAEVRAAYDAAVHHREVESVQLFTDSRYTAVHVTNSHRLFDTSLRQLRVLPELLKRLAAMENVEVYHVRAHKALFYNELVDKMVGFVARGEMTVEAAQDWAYITASRGVIENTIGKNGKPMYIRKTHERNLNVMESIVPVPVK